jgi:hypothetical protein
VKLSSLDSEAVALLQALSGPHGIHASQASTANYRAVFARDAVMAGVAGLLLGDAGVTAGLVRTLEQLRALQGPEGQVASNFEVQPDGATHVSFGTLAPRFDAATWYLVGVALAVRGGAIDAEPYRASVRQVVQLLAALEYNGRHLIYVPTGGNWADEYIYDGYILYDQVLRAWGLQLLADVYDEPAWRTKSQAIAEAISTRFFTADTQRAAAPHRRLLAGAASHDVRPGRLRAARGLGVRTERARQALDWIDGHFLQRGALPPAFHPVIEEGDPDWPALRRYHLHDFRNAPHEYHNGGIWPIWLGWLALGQVQLGVEDHLARLRAVTATAMGRLKAFAFEEYLHGLTWVAGGTPQMAYTATGLTFLRLAGSDAQRALLTP